MAADEMDSFVAREAAAGQRDQQRTSSRSIERIAARRLGRN
jgi:hypothetical protein